MRSDRSSTRAGEFPLSHGAFADHLFRRAARGSDLDADLYWSEFSRAAS